jgi:hypothetical protein
VNVGYLVRMKFLLAFLQLLPACSEPGEDPAVTDVGDVGADGPDDATDTTDATDGDLGDDVNDADSSDTSDAAPDEPDLGEPRLTIKVVTFNTGSGPGSHHDAEPDDGYSREHGDLTQEWYGNGLAWESFIEDTYQFFDATQPGIVAFQEIFWAGECPNIPEEARIGFVCEGWQPDDPTVASRVLGDGWQVACHPRKPDKCLAVHESVGRFEGCDEELCLEGLAGFPVPNCGSGARVARGRINLVGGDTLTVVNIHGTSGFTAADAECRRSQVDQIFVDLGDGEPGANGEVNLVMGDLNTDPGRLAAGDPSAARWNEVAAEGEFHFHTEVGMDAPPTYAGVANIDHVLSDSFLGDCVHPGITDGHPPVTEAVFFDHAPVVCDLDLY